MTLLGGLGLMGFALLLWAQRHYGFPVSPNDRFFQRLYPFGKTFDGAVVDFN